jgi:hypothetical protein
MLGIYNLGRLYGMGFGMPDIIAETKIKEVAECGVNVGI